MLFKEKLDSVQAEHQAHDQALKQKLSEAISTSEQLKLQVIAMDERHAAEMELVDAKIRKALAGKDKQIIELEQKLRIYERRIKDAETLIEDLNNGFSVISS